MILCDTNILIEHYRRNLSVIAELKKIGQPNIAISIVTAGELIYGALNKRELSQILKDIAHLNLFHINQQVGDIQLQLMADYSLSHNLTLPDAFIAATALHHAIPLYSLNTKDFKYIPKLKLYL
ncbi:MAG: type II toxin-antitoxin system VapC family toxin [Lewinellaceae bacterium]|nr:type II toxin-antitoxin system VapC family toxin [Lewinellaceae bacterium]MCB9288089.1 type II toxin-antitoxin system VapC family toxin [Lewinellaceae bacterium]